MNPETADGARSQREERLAFFRRHVPALRLAGALVSSVVGVAGATLLLF